MTQRNTGSTQWSNDAFLWALLCCATLKCDPVLCPSDLSSHKHMHELTEVQLYKNLIMMSKFRRLQPAKTLPQTPGLGQSENTQKIRQPSTQASCCRSWASMSCDLNPLPKNPVKTCKPGRTTYYTSTLLLGLRRDKGHIFKSLSKI